MSNQKASQTIRVSDGAIEYTWPVTVTTATGNDISTDPVAISLGSINVPGVWATTGVVITHPSLSSVTVQMLVSAATVTPGVYYVWVKVTDSAETVVRNTGRIVIE